MSVVPPERAPIRRFFLTVVLLAFATRAGVWFESEGTVPARLLIGDGAHFDTWARTLAESKGIADWIGDEVFYQAPLYPYFLGASYTLVGADPNRARLIQAGLGALACALTALVARRFFGPRAGWAAGVMAALFAPWIWFDGLIQKTSLALFLTAFLLERITHPNPNRKNAFTAGALLGLLALTRENALILAPLVLAACVVRCRGMGERKAGLTHAALALAGMLVVLSPVALRNAHVGGGFVPTSFNAGVNFYLGNNADADGRYTALIHGREHPSAERADAMRLAQEAEGRELSPAAVSSYWFSRGWSDVRADPLRWVGLLARKTMLIANDHELMDTDAFPLGREGSVLLDVLARAMRFGSLFVLAVAGLWFTRGRWRDTWFLTASALALTASIALFFVAARFRIGLVPFLIPFAAVGLVRLLERPNGRALARSLRWLVLPTVLAFYPITAPPLSLGGDPISAAWANLANGALEQDDPETAATLARRALALEPDLAIAVFNLGVATRLTNELDEARLQLNRSFELEPQLEADARFQLGLLEANAGDELAALPHFRRAAELAPHDADSRYNYALALERLGHPIEARREYEACLLADPGYGPVRVKLGLD